MPIRVVAAPEGAGDDALVCLGFTPRVCRGPCALTGESEAVMRARAGSLRA